MAEKTTEPRRVLRGAFVRQQVCSSPTIAKLWEQRGPVAVIIAERLILWSDDDGRFMAEPGLVKARCLPLQARATRTIRADLQAMHDLGYIVLYEARGTLYGAFPRWRQHQPKPKPSHYAPSELPPPPEPNSEPKSPPSLLPSPLITKRIPPQTPPQFAVANLDPDSERQATIQASIELGDFSKAEPLGVDRAAWNVLRRGWQRSQISPGGEA